MGELKIKRKSSKAILGDETRVCGEGGGLCYCLEYQSPVVPFPNSHYIYIYRRGGVESGVLGEITSLPLSVFFF
jgi:hypothetical protein